MCYSTCVGKLSGTARGAAHKHSHSRWHRYRRRGSAHMRPDITKPSGAPRDASSTRAERLFGNRAFQPVLGVQALWRADAGLIQEVTNHALEADAQEDSRNEPVIDSASARQKDAVDLFVSDNGVVFVPPSVRQGTLPLMLRELLEMRIQIKVF